MIYHQPTPVRTKTLWTPALQPGSSFGLFQTNYTEDLHRPSSDILWIGSTRIFFLFFGGIFSGRLTDGGYFKTVFTLGAIIQLIGIFTSSASKSYYRILLSQGVCTGLDNGLILCPALTILSQYFKARRGIAIAIAVSGSGTGGIIFPAIANSTLNLYGTGWTLRIFGFITLVTHIPCILWLKPRLPPRKSGPLIELSALKEKPYVFFNLAMFFNFLGLYFTFFYLGSYAREVLGASTPVSTDLLLILNGIGILGRLIPSYLADRYLGLLNCMIPTNLSACVLMYSWAAVDTIGGLYGFDTIYGFFAAGVQSLFPAVLSALTGDPTKIGTRMGMTFADVGVSCLVGLPISGQLITANPNGQYLYAQMAAGTFLLLGTAFMLFACLALAGPTRQMAV
ncbi:unnamed protein product [Penicillium olsonii]|uniref:Major facilitator superfamily (MFS) profile domain-containing protein n=1 Tax=Penicillium olsonii TaxID=99116 RepID=A0A9W4I0P6_PENOL|nr:unnamed protein product [Penicillium olsonii]CAG8254741.1 unnamed protein product [Penicillium olsonii]